MTRPTVSATAERLYLAMGAFTQQDEVHGWVLLKLCNVLTSSMAEIDALVSDTDSQDGWGPLFDPATCPARALAWLGQLIGVVIPAGTPESTARDMVTHPTGWARGTPTSVRGAAQIMLTGSRYVLLNERTGGDAYALEVVVYSGELTDLTALTAAVTAALPAGLSLTVTVLSGWTIDEMETETSAYDVAYVESTYATVAAFERVIP